MWRFVPSNSTGTVCSDTFHFRELGFLRRSIEILFPGPSFLYTELILPIRSFVDQDMAHRADIPLRGDNAIELFEKRKADMAARAAAKAKVPIVVRPPSSRFRRQKKRVVEDTSPSPG